MARSIHAWLAASALGGTLCAAPALAQQTGADEAAAAPGEIIVTAQRRAERLQEVPLAISAFTGESLQSQGITSTRDLTIVTPGLNFTQSSFSTSQPFAGSARAAFRRARNRWCRSMSTGFTSRSLPRR